MQPFLARRIVSWYEIAGGLVGVGATIVFASRLLERVPPGYKAQVLAVMMISAACFALLAFAGVQLLRRRRLGIHLSVALQIAQIPMWSAFGTSWAFTAGPYFTPTLSQSGLGLLFGATVRWSIQFRGALDPSWIGINLVPLVALLLLRETLRDRSRSNLGALVEMPPPHSVAPPA